LREHLRHGASAPPSRGSEENRCSAVDASPAQSVLVVFVVEPAGPGHGRSRWGEKALLAQPEVGFGVVPGGGGLDWLPPLVGRSRAIEIVTSADDYDADTAERYGWINRAVPDDQLDATVDALANRIAAWDPQALADAKRVINERVPPPSEGDLLESFSVILAAVACPGAQARLRAMEELGWGSRSDVERDHPAHLVDLAERIAAEVDR
jgi:Enoyl-CoA hydratase/isomerase